MRELQNLDVYAAVILSDCKTGDVVVSNGMEYKTLLQNRMMTQKLVQHFADVSRQ